MKKHIPQRQRRKKGETDSFERSGHERSCFDKEDALSDHRKDTGKNRQILSGSSFFMRDIDGERGVYVIMSVDGISLCNNIIRRWYRGVIIIVTIINTRETCRLSVSSGVTRCLGHRAEVHQR